MKKLPLVFLVLFFACNTAHHIPYVESGQPVPFYAAEERMNSIPAFQHEDQLLLNRTLQYRNPAKAFADEEQFLKSSAIDTPHTKLSGGHGQPKQVDPAILSNPEYIEASKAKSLALWSTLFCYLVYPIGVIIAIVAITKGRKILKRHGKTENFVGKDEAQRAVKIAITAIIAGAVFLALAILLFIALINALADASLSSCFIATNVYGSYDAPEVLVLRRFRDEKLQPHWYGRLFIRFYYTTSPLFLKIFRKVKIVNRACRYMLNTFVEELTPKHTSIQPN